MEIRSYNSEFAIANLLFKKVFSNIQIERTNNDGSKKLIKVNCQFGQRSRIFKSWQNSERLAKAKFPMIIINRGGYSRNPQRLSDLHNEVKYEITSRNRVYDYITPVPISISYEVTVVSKYPSDIDQIASNFMVFFNSSIYVSCVHPKYEGIKMNNQITMEDSVNEEHPDELDGSQDDFVTSTFSFTFNTFLFAGIKQAKKIPVQVLSSFTSAFVSSDVFNVDVKDVDAFLQEHPNAKISAELTSQITADVTAYVDNPEISDYVYDEFVPAIKKIEMSIYPTPTPSSYEEHISIVDSQYDDSIYQMSGYISSLSYTSAFEDYIDDDGNLQSRLSSVYPNDWQEELVDTYETIMPYKDRLIWKIDEASSKQFPDNVGAYRSFQVL